WSFLPRALPTRSPPAACAPHQGLEERTGLSEGLSRHDLTQRSRSTQRNIAILRVLCVLRVSTCVTGGTTQLSAPTPDRCSARGEAGPHARGARRLQGARRQRPWSPDRPD